MPRIARSVLVLVGLVVGARHLAAQDHTLGLNLGVNDGSQVGLTILTSPALALRPSLSVSWISFDFGGTGTVDRTNVSFDLDVLFRHATWDRVTLYSGPGIRVGYMNGATGEESSAIWGLRYLLGARLRVVDRVALFGEAGLAYFNNAGYESVGIGTRSLGIIVFLK